MWTLHLSLVLLAFRLSTSFSSDLSSSESFISLWDRDFLLFSRGCGLPSADVLGRHNEKPDGIADDDVDAPAFLIIWAAAFAPAFERLPIPPD
jgi:hypothetical protein